MRTGPMHVCGGGTRTWSTAATAPPGRMYTLATSKSGSTGMVTPMNSELQGARGRGLLAVGGCKGGG